MCGFENAENSAVLNSDSKEKRLCGLSKRRVALRTKADECSVANSILAQQVGGASGRVHLAGVTVSYVAPVQPSTLRQHQCTSCQRLL